jgi:putative heme-binding domain-containing protein
MESLVNAAVKRRRRPAGAVNNLDKLFDEPTAYQLAGLWKMQRHRQKIVDTALGIAPAKREFRRNAILGAAAFGDKDALVNLCQSDTEMAFRVLAIQQLVRLDAKQAAFAASRMLRTLGSDPPSVEVVQQIVDAFVQRKNGAAELAAALKTVAINDALVTAISRRAGAAGRGGKPLVNAMRSVRRFVSMKTRLSPAEMKQLIKDVAKNGDPARGESIYHRQELNCITCHSIGGAGGVVGPDLISLGASTPTDYIIDSMLQPNKKIKEGYHTTQILTLDGKQVSGKLIGETADRITLRDANGKQHIFEVNDIDEQTISNVSLMPEDLVARLDRKDFVDLIAFMSRLGKEGPYQTPAEKFIRRWILPDKSVIFSRVDGSLKIDEPGQKLVVGEIEVTSAGRIGLRLIGSTAGQIAVNDKATVGVKEPLEVELPKGRHRITVKFSNKNSKPFKLQVFDVPNSTGDAVPINR